MGPRLPLSFNCDISLLASATFTEIMIGERGIHLTTIGKTDSNIFQVCFKITIPMCYYLFLIHETVLWLWKNVAVMSMSLLQSIVIVSLLWYTHVTVTLVMTLMSLCH